MAMINPWKSESKINPQLEDGYGQLNNKIMEALIAGLSTGAQFKFVFAVIRKTYGFGKLWDAISVSQFEEMTRLSARTIRRTQIDLKKAKIIYYVSLPSTSALTPGSALNGYLFNKHYDTWDTVSLTRVSALTRMTNKPDIDDQQGGQTRQPQKKDKRKIKKVGAKTAPPDPKVNIIKMKVSIEYVE